ncbi:MAG: sigma-54-dependent Fis family transcriptional regulator [Acidobacteria bacterium]|nr:sigma-54-dependent Fis family transcriptional regulator [Acidobacteriota bacterium]MCW5970742.1 sigma-54-dependent Fis family transcriptional regulator [Blastocatellales bacterium]
MMRNGTGRESVAAIAALPASMSGMNAAQLMECECFVGISAWVGELRRYVERQAQHHQAVLLLGERGLRQEQIARAIHALSERRQKPFLSVNAQTLSPEELDHLLNGPNGVLGNKAIGTVFLNELVGLAPLLQQRIAIYLEEQRWREPGSGGLSGPRLILATQWHPESMTVETRIAYGLVEMLRPQGMVLAPLRERREDIPLIAAAVIRRLARRYGCSVDEVAPAVMRLLAQYRWERNIDELEAVLESVIAHLPPLRITAAHLPAALRNTTFNGIPAQGIELETTIEGYERRLIEVALKQTGGNQTRAAQLLGLRVQTLNAKIKRLSIDCRRTQV